MDFGESIGLLLFLLFLFLQFIASLFGRNKTKGKRPPSPAGDAAEGAPAASAPSTFEEALRQIQEALSEANRPPEPAGDATPPGDRRTARPDAPPAESLPPYVDYAPGAPPTVEPGVDEENSPAFQHFDDFERRGEAHFDSGAHERFEAARAEREAVFDRPLKTDRPTLMEREVAQGTLRGQRSVSEIDAPDPLAASAYGRTASPNAPTSRLRDRLHSPDAIRDAYRLHVILGEPRARRRRG